MARQRVLILEDDAAIEEMLCDVFADENLDVTLCNSLAELRAGIVQYPGAAVVSDSWERGDYLTLSPLHRADLVALAGTSEVVLTTGRQWAKDYPNGALGTVEIVQKPYDLNQLMAAVRAALERASMRAAASLGTHVRTMQ